MNFEEMNPPKEAIEHTARKFESNQHELSDLMPITYPELEELCKTSERTQKAFTEMMRYAAAYVTDVWNMRQLYKQKNEFTEEEWAEKLAKSEDDRTRLHNLYIDSIAILSRALNSEEVDTEWIRDLMGGGTSLHRAACGNFAIMLIYSEYVNTGGANVTGEHYG